MLDFESPRCLSFTANMPDKNLTALLYKKGDLQMVDRSVPEPGPGQVQLQMQQVGVCGSDVHFWTKGRIGDFVVEAPMALGHESSGVISKLGPGVKSLKVDFLTNPDHVSYEEGALLEPLSVAVHATNRAGMKLGDVLICGAGPIGLMHTVTAKARGASVVCVTDLDDSRLKMAKQLGADHVVKVTSKDALATAKAVEEAVGDKVDVAMECSGAPSSIQLSVYATKSGGVVTLVGLGNDLVEVPVLNAGVREVDIRGAIRYAAGCYPTALAMVASGSVNVKPLITHRFKLEESIQAFETAKRGDGIKVMISCGRN